MGVFPCGKCGEPWLSFDAGDSHVCNVLKVRDLELQTSELEKKLKVGSQQIDGLLFAVNAQDKKIEDANRLNGELVALLKKIDGFFENPKIVPFEKTLILEVPYEIAAGVKGALVASSLKRKGEAT